MDSLYLLIPVAVVLFLLAVRLLLWAVRSGQYEDLDREASRILEEEETSPGASQEDTGDDPGRS